MLFRSDALTHTATGLVGSGALDSSAGASAAATLTAGIQDLTNTLVGEYDLNDILRIILETMYRGMAFSHVLCARAMHAATACKRALDSVCALTNI